MNQAVFRAKVPNDFRGPRSAWLPCEAEGLRAELLKETREILDVEAVRLERSGTLEKDDTGPNGMGNFKRLCPCLPDFIRILKRSKERAASYIDRVAQAAVGGGGRCM